jgi:hypothetical protein
MAVNMKKKFEAAGILDILEQSVKFNLLFYRSVKAKDITNIELIQFSESKAFDILHHISPENIMAEGLQTYTRLKQLLKGTDEKITRMNDKAVVCTCKTNMDIPLIAIIHPSGARGISNDLLNFIGLELKMIMNEGI